MSGCIFLPYQMSLRSFVLINPPSELLTVNDSSIEAEIDSSYSLLR